MPDAALLNWTLNQAIALLLIMTRVGPLLFFMPVIGSRSVPTQVKVLFTLMTALILVPVVEVSAADLPAIPAGLTLLVLSEVLFGAILALFVRLLFAAIDVAGQMVGIQMGMGVAHVLNPEFGNQVPLVGQFWGLLAILLFLSVDGHHIFFRTLVESFRWVRPGQLEITTATYRGMMEGAGHMFVLAVKIMAPATAALFFSHVAMGIIAKTVPQIPVLIVGMPLNIAIGLIFVSLSLGYFLPLMIKNFEMLDRLLPRLAAGLGG